MKAGLVLLGIFVLAGCGTNAAAPPAPELTQQVGYGAGVYRYGCARCHAVGRSSVQLTAAQLTANFASADELYRFVRRTMPLDEPASLPDGDYWAVVAYMLNDAGLLPLARDRQLGPHDAQAIKIAPQPAATLEPTPTSSSPK